MIVIKEVYVTQRFYASKYAKYAQLTSVVKVINSPVTHVLNFIIWLVFVADITRALIG